MGTKPTRKLDRNWLIALAAGLGLLMAGGAGCGGNNAKGGTGGSSGMMNGIGPQSGTNVADPSGDDLTSPAVTVQGGAAVAVGGQGQNGGIVHLDRAQADILVGSRPAMAPVGTGSLPSAPSGAYGGRVVGAGERSARSRATRSYPARVCRAARQVDASSDDRRRRRPLRHRDVAGG